MSFAKFALPAIALALLAGCKSTGDIDVAGGVGITAIRSPCPRVGVPAGTGDLTTFSPADSRDESALDVTAVLTNVSSTCNDDADGQVVTTVTFDVLGSRTHGEEARDVTLPYFVTLVRGGTAVVAKRVGHVTIHFDAGQTRASARGSATTQVTRAAATLSKEVRDRLTKRRKAGNEDAAMDPLQDPSVRTAVLSATFEALIGFQLTSDQLKYNVTR